MKLSVVLLEVNDKKCVRSIVYSNVHMNYYLVVSIWNGQFYHESEVKFKKVKDVIEYLFDDIDFKKSKYFYLKTKTRKAVVYSDESGYGYLKKGNERAVGFSSIYAALECFTYLYLEKFYD